MAVVEQPACECVGPMNVPYDCGVCTNLLDKWCKPNAGKATFESSMAEHLAREKSTRHLSAEMR
jgi:hypothetical protein